MLLFSGGGGVLLTSFYVTSQYLGDFRDTLRPGKFSIEFSSSSLRVRTESSFDANGDFMGFARNSMVSELLLNARK